MVQLPSCTSDVCHNCRQSTVRHVWRHVCVRFYSHVTACGSADAAASAHPQESCRSAWRNHCIYICSLPRPRRYALLAASSLERLTSGATALAPQSAATAIAAELAALRVPFRPGFTTPFPRVPVTLLPFARSAAILRNSAALACLTALARLLLNLTRSSEGCAMAAACGAIEAAATLLVRASTGEPAVSSLEAGPAPTDFESGMLTG